MSNLSFTIGSVTITPFFWGLFLATIFSAFSFWRGLKEDFPEEEIYKLTLLLLTSSLIFSRIFGLMVNLPPLGVFIGAVLALIWREKGWQKKFWEELDHLSLAWIYFLFFGGIGKFLSDNNIWSLSYLIISLVGYSLYLFFKKKYRSFLWYKSGKTGFLFWSLSGYFFFCFFLLDFFLSSDLYWERWLWFLAFVSTLIIIYFRAERHFKEDLKNLANKVARNKKR